MYKIFAVSILFLFTNLLLGCSDNPDPINYGSDICVHCNMKIMDNRFGAALVNSNSKTFKFDATECMLNYLKENSISVKSIHVTDFNNPGFFLNANKSYFLISSNRKSPMGENLSAYKNKSDAENAKISISGDIFTYEELKNQIGK